MERIKFPNVYKHCAEPVYDDNLEELHPHQWSSVYYEPVEGRVILFPSNSRTRSRTKFIRY